MARGSQFHDLAVTMNRTCSDKHLAEIASWIVDWKAISPFFGLTEAQESVILGSNTHSVCSQKIAMLRLWKEKKGTKATYKRLCRVFKKCDMLHLELKLRDLLAESSSSSSDEEIPQADVPISSYAAYLKERYISISHSHTSHHWTHLPRCEFIQLAMISNEEMRHGEPDEEVVRLAQQGKVETILNRKKSIDLQSLISSTQETPLVVLPPCAQPPLPKGRVVLIEGAPGGGKSTLALHICHQWAVGASWLADFDIVVLAYLRDEAIQNANTLADILPAADTIQMSQLKSKIVSKIQSSYKLGTSSKHQSKVLFIFDGWDEFPHNLMNNSLISTIIQQPYKLALHHSTVLITSRPVASGNLLPIVKQRVEILGFTQHQIRQYIEKAMNGNSTHIHKLVRHFEKHPVIEGCCYVPLHSAILVHIFLTMKGTLPTTLHELFCSLILCCIAREQATHIPETNLPELSSLDDLPDDIKSKLNNLSILAYNGVMGNKVVFNLRDLQASNLISTDLPSLGLLQAVEGLTLTSKMLSYNFLHISVQDILAAYCISQKSPSEQVYIFKKLFESSRFQAVLHYYCGFTKLVNPEIQGFISFYQREKSDFRELLPLLHCFFEAQQPSLCQLVDSRFIPTDVCSSDLVPVDLVVIGYFITSLLSASAADTPTAVQFSITKINDYRLKLLLSELSKYPVRGSGALSERKLILNLSTPSITEKGVKHLASHLEQSSAISELALIIEGLSSNVKGDLVLHIAEALQTNSSLTCLTLGNIKLIHSKQNGSALTTMLQLNKSLTHLDLSKNSELSDLLARCIFEGLKHNTALLNLNLSSTGVTLTDPDTARSLTEMLEVNKSLTHLDLSINKILSYSGARCIFEGLKRNTSLVYLDLSNTGIRTIDANRTCCIFEGLQYNKTLVNLNLSNTGITATDPDTEALTEMLRVNKSITRLNLSLNKQFSESGACCMFEGLQHNNTLVYLSLSNTGITDSDPHTAARSLTKMLQMNKSLTHLDLSSNEAISDSLARCIFEGLQQNNTLVYLNLSYTNITAKDSNTARSLTKMLEINKSLAYFDLSCEDSIPENQIVSLVFSGLKQNTTLSDLILCGRNITDDSAKCIAEVLKSNNCLLMMDISRTYAGCNNIRLILDSLKHNTTLKKLCISDNWGTYSVVMDFNKAREELGLPPIKVVAHSWSDGY